MKNFNPSDPVHFKKLIVMLDKKFQKIRIHQRELNHMVGLLSSNIDDDIDHLLSTLKEILLELEKNKIEIASSQIEHLYKCLKKENL
tara:strand:+ start:10369 stop:10629 length:261 start_codon:yes stop_codon:yes gene_type:complete